MAANRLLGSDGGARVAAVVMKVRPPTFSLTILVFMVFVDRSEKL